MTQPGPAPQASPHFCQIPAEIPPSSGETEAQAGYRCRARVSLSLSAGCGNASGLGLGLGLGPPPPWRPMLVPGPLSSLDEGTGRKGLCLHVRYLVRVTFRSTDGETEAGICGRLWSYPLLNTPP